MKSLLPNGKLITGYYGMDGVMTKGWNLQEEAEFELENYYEPDDELFVIEIEPGEWVIAY